MTTAGQMVIPEELNHGDRRDTENGDRLISPWLSTAAAKSTGAFILEARELTALPFRASVLSGARQEVGLTYGGDRMFSSEGDRTARPAWAFILLAVNLAFGATAGGSKEGDMFERDVFKTAAGDLTIVFVGHGTLMFEFGGKTVHIDPVSAEADYATMPKADLILVTHVHGDHLDLAAIARIRTDQTKLVMSEVCRSKLESGIVMANGAAQTVAGLKIEAVPAYNIVHKRGNGLPYHPRGEGNGYVITFGDRRVYVAGDTENTPEMKALPDIDIAFLPMNLPYTMTPAMVADAARAFRPKVLYPYHFGQTDTSELVKQLEQEAGIEVRIRKMQ